MISAEEALSILESTLAHAKKLGATDADGLLYASNELSTSIRQGQPEGVERAENTALGLRVFVGKRTATVSSSDFSKETLATIAERAVSMAKIAPEDPFVALAAPEQLAQDVPELDLYDSHEPTPEWLMDVARKTEAAALATQGITNTEGADAAYTAGRMALMTSNGFAHSHPSSHFMVSASVLAGEGVNMERDYEYCLAIHKEDLWEPEFIGKEAARKALARMGATSLPSAQLPVIFHPRIAKGLIANLAGAISGAAIARDTSFLKKSMGERIFKEGIRIVDNPHIKRGLGSKPFDGEGVRNTKRAFVEDGVLNAWLLDIRSANKLGLQTLGNASRGIHSAPHPATSNFYLENGTLSPKELMGDIAYGLYITETFGSGANLLTGDISVGAAGFLIEKGEITRPVHEFTIAGNLKDIYKQLTPANDLEFRYSINAPTVRVEQLTIAGK